MTSQTTITAAPEARSLRGCADALDALARVIGPAYSTIRGVQALVVGDRVTLTTDAKSARSLARALGFDPDAYATHSAGLVHEWRGTVADLDVQVFGRRADDRAQRMWDAGAKDAARTLAAQPVPDRLVADVLGIPVQPGPEMKATYRVVREHCTRIVEDRQSNAEGRARADVRSYLQVLDETGFRSAEDDEAADAAFLTVFGVSR